MLKCLYFNFDAEVHSSEYHFISPRLSDVCIIDPGAVRTKFDVAKCREICSLFDKQITRHLTTSTLVGATSCLYLTLQIIGHVTRRLASTEYAPWTTSGESVNIQM